MVRVTTKSNKNYHIEVLRAVAIVFTLVLHFKAVFFFNQKDFLLPFYNRFDLSVGVDLFLVISGYVITRSLVDSSYTASFSRKSNIVAFWMRRVFRLLPTAWIWLVVGLLVNLIFNTYSGNVDLFWTNLLSVGAAMLNLSNIYEPYCFFNQELAWCARSILSSPTDGILHSHYWSLSLEEQFYIIFPLCFFFVKRPWFIALLILAIAVQFFWKRPFFHPFWFVKTDALCWGVLIAFLSYSKLYYSKLYGQLRLFVCRHAYLAQGLMLVLIVALPFVASKIQGVFTMQPYGVGVVALMSAAIVLLASFDFKSVDRDKSLVRCLLYLGSRSYALYIIHMILYFSVWRITYYYSPVIDSHYMQAIFNVALCLIALGFTLVLAEWNYRVIEKPLRLKGRQLSTDYILGRGKQKGLVRRV